MNILVTGGAGFIGSNFIDYVLRHTDHRIINIDVLTYAATVPDFSAVPSFSSDRYSFIQSNIADITVDQLRAFAITHVINFAAETHVDRSISSPDIFIDTNITATYLLLKTLRAYHQIYPDVKIVHISTDEVFGQLRVQDAPFTEDSPYAPNSPYSASKASSDHLVRAFHHTYNLPIILTNCSNNYGPRQYPEKFIPVIIHHALQDTAVPVYGTGMNIRDWLYVEDHCRALYLILCKGHSGDRFNIGGSTEKTNLEVVHTIFDVLGKTPHIAFVQDRQGHDFRYAINSCHLYTTLGWKPHTDFQHGIACTVEWYLDNQEWMEQCVPLV